MMVLVLLAYFFIILHSSYTFEVLFRLHKLSRPSLSLSAVEFLKTVPQGKYDAIIVDSSDPVGKLSLIVDLKLGSPLKLF